MAAEDVRLALEYGVAPSVIEELRRTRCVLGEHWIRVPEDGSIAWLEAGLKFLPVLLGLEKKEGGGVPRSPVAGKVHLLSVLRIYPNPIWVLVSTPDGLTSNVQVRRNERLTRNMQIECRQHSDGRWECTQKGLAVPLKPLASKATTATAQPQ